MSTRPIERRRLLAVGLVVVLLSLAGVANATIRPRDLAQSVTLQHDVAPSVVTDAATSSAWYCAGPLPIGTPHEAASIALTNLGHRAVAGEVVIASNTDGRPPVMSVEVQPGSESVVGLPRKGARGSAAATVLVNGSGIAVEELIHGASGVSASPCADHTSALDYVATGSTLGANNLSLAVFDPGATPAVVGVSFVTSSGPVAPPAFQGLSVGAGHVQVLDIGHYVPNKPVVATIVTSTGGHVVTGALVAAVTDHAVLSSLTTGVATTASSWLLPAAPTSQGAQSTFNVLDPSNRAAKVVLRLGAPGASSLLEAVVPAHGVVALTPAGEGSPGAMHWASVRSTGAAVVVSRETVVAKTVVSRAEQKVAAEEAAQAGSRSAAAVRARAAAEKAAAAARAAAARVAAAAKHGRHVVPSTTTTTEEPPTTTTLVPYSTVSALPEVQPGVAVTSGVSAAATSWVLPGGESDATTSEVVVVDNTSHAEARIQIKQLDDAGAGPYGAAAFASMPPLAVAPGATVTVNLATVVGTDATLPVLVSSSEPVVTGELLYARKTASFTLATAIPIR